MRGSRGVCSKVGECFMAGVSGLGELTGTNPGELIRGTDYFFLPADCLAVIASFFFVSALLFLVCFCEEAFWLAFGDLSPMSEASFLFKLPR